MPAPYRIKADGKGSRATGSCTVERSKRKALNLIILALSWLHLGRPLGCPAEMHPGAPLSRRQWATVHRLEKYLEDLAFHGDVTSSQMGRTAAKVESLSDLLVRLATKLGTAGLGRSEPYGPALPHRLPDCPSSLQEGSQVGQPGEVVGHLKQGLPQLAKEVDASRLKFPQGEPAFDPAPLLPDDLRELYVNPATFTREPEPDDAPLPHVRVRATRAGTFELLHFLDKHNRLRFVPEAELRTTHLCGVFSLLKDEEKDRLILDARAPNTLEQQFARYTRTLGSIQPLLQVELLPEETLVLHGDDLRDYYYGFVVTPSRLRRNGINFKVRPEEICDFNCYEERFAACKNLYPALATMGMGDGNAVELGQSAHVLLGLQAGAFTPEELLLIHGRVPRGPLATGVIIDDFIVVERVLRHVFESGIQTEGQRRMDTMNAAYKQVGLLSHDGKAFRRQQHGTFWGHSVCGVSGLVRAAPERLLPLMEVTAKLAQTGLATVGLLEVIAGCWVAVLQVRKRMMSLLEQVYVAQRGRLAGDVVALSPALISELWLLVTLAPLACTNLRASTLPELHLTDASNWGTAHVTATLELPLARELHRHALVRGLWNKLLTPWKVWLKEAGRLLLDEELPDGVPLVTHPLWCELAQILQFRPGHRRRARRRAHINILEVMAILILEETLAERSPGTRPLVGSDSQVSIAALLKGRSSSPAINRCLQRSLANHLGAELYPSYGFVPSMLNVADDPTRHVGIRRPSKAPPAWFTCASAGDFKLLDAWLAKIGFDPLTLAGFPAEVVASSAQPTKDELGRFVQSLRLVQKPARLAKFDEAHRTTDGTLRFTGGFQADRQEQSCLSDACGEIESAAPPSKTVSRVRFLAVVALD